MSSAARCQELHQQAMIAANEGNFEAAFQLEALAAQECPADLQPSHSVLHRSAAALALRIGNKQAATRYAALGLAGLGVPDEIADELREVIFDAAK